jgi:hypothetical protein
LRDGRSLRDAERAEMGERDRIPVRRLDRQRQAAAGDGAGEADGACSRGRHRVAVPRADLDPSAFAGGVRVRAVEGERLEHRPGDRPGPRLCRRGGEPEEREDDEDEAAHRITSVV